MNRIVSLKELRTDMEKYIGIVNKGVSLLVLRKSKPVFRIVPSNQNDLEWEDIIDFTEFRRSGIKIEELISRLEKLAKKEKK